MRRTDRLDFGDQVTLALRLLREAWPDEPLDA